MSAGVWMSMLMALAACSRAAEDAGPSPSASAAPSETPATTQNAPTTKLSEKQLLEAYSAVQTAIGQKEPFDKQLAAATAKAGPPLFVQTNAAGSTSYWWSWGPRINGPCLEFSLSDKNGEIKIGGTKPAKCGM